MTKADTEIWVYNQMMRGDGNIRLRYTWKSSVTEFPDGEQRQNYTVTAGETWKHDELV